MDKEFLGSIHLNSGYLSESAIWKNNLTPFAEGNFAVPKLKDLYAGSIGAMFNNLQIPKIFDFTENAGKMAFGTICATEINYGKSNFENLAYEKNPLGVNTLFIGNDVPKWHIADANVNKKDLQTYNMDNFYTTPTVAYDEAGGNLSHILPQNNISLQSVTYQNFKDNGNMFTVTSPFGEIGTVSLHIEAQGTSSRSDCGHLSTATLTNTTTGQTITFCTDVLKSNDFGLAVYGIAFHSTCTIFTEDSCLGYAFKELHSFRPSNNIFWKDNIKIKNNILCSHNH